MLMNSTGVYFDFVSEEALVVFLHGYRGNKDELSFLRSVIKGKRYSFLSFTYGKRDPNGAVSRVRGLDKKIFQTISSFLEQHHYQKVYLVGYSLGAALAFSLAKLIPCQGLILISVFDDRKELLRSKGIGLPLGENIRPVELVRKLQGLPMVFIHGIMDRSVSPERAKKVYEANSLHSFFISLPVSHYFNEPGSQIKLGLAVKAAFSFLS